MSRWFRFYDGALDDPKVQGLPGDLFKIWVNLLCVASRNAGRLPVDELAFSLRISQVDAKEAIEKLQSYGLLDLVDEVMQPHNWDKRQFKSDVSTERVKQHRQRSGPVSGYESRNVSPPVSETPPETEQNTDQKKEKHRKAPRRISYPPRFTVFWEGYPTDTLMSKSEAFTEWQNLPRDDQEAAIAALPAFKAATAKLGSDHRVIHACRFLKKRRFDGFAEAAAHAQAVFNPNSYRAEYGSEEWLAWEADRKVRSQPMPNPVNGHWTFPSRFPEGYVPRETSSEAA